MMFINVVVENSENATLAIAKKLNDRSKNLSLTVCYKKIGKCLKIKNCLSDRRAGEGQINK